MKKNIMLVQGGGRPKGNTYQLAQAFMAGARSAGHEVSFFSLHTYIVNGCMGCNACRYGKPCIQKDDFNSLRAEIINADCIAFASPLFFWTISAKLKAFIERFYCIAEYDEHPAWGRYEKYPAKDSVLLMTSADDYFWTYEQAVSYYQFTLINYIGFKDKGKFLAGGCGDTNGLPRISETKYLDEVFEFGKNLY